MPEDKKEILAWKWMVDRSIGTTAIGTAAIGTTAIGTTAIDSD